MWSDRYYYLNIYKDEKLSSETDTNELREFILTIPELEKNGKFTFKNKKDFPFIDLLILKAKDINNWTENDTNSKKTNLITIVCAKGNEVNFKKIELILIKIASFLNWKLVDEETDDGIENYKIWDTKKVYKILLDGKEIGTSELEKGDPPMGVAFGKLNFKDKSFGYKQIKEFWVNNNIEIATDYPKDKMISTMSTDKLKVINQEGVEIKGVGNQITGMDNEEYEISVFGISYPFYGTEFPKLVKEYENMFNKK